MRIRSLLLIVPSLMMSQFCVAQDSSFYSLKELHYLPTYSAVAPKLSHRGPVAPKPPVNEWEEDDASQSSSEAYWWGSNELDNDGLWTVRGQAAGSYYSPESWRDIAVKSFHDALGFETSGTTSLNITHTRIIVSKEECLQYAQSGSEDIFLQFRLSLTQSHFTQPYRIHLNVSYETQEPSGRYVTHSIAMASNSSTSSTALLETSKFKISKEFCESAKGLRVTTSIWDVQAIGISEMRYGVKSLF